ncbi:MAG: ribosome silencing factor [Bacteroidota bacterium]
MTSRTLAKKIAELALSKKATDVILMDLRKLNGPADFFVVCSTDSDTQVKAVAEGIRRGSEELGARMWHSEGLKALSWVLLDFVDVVVHVFHREARGFYAIERLWGDATITNVEDTADGTVFEVERVAKAKRPPAKKKKPVKRKKTRKT